LLQTASVLGYNERGLKLYSRRGVLEYCIVDWQQRKMEVYRRQEQALHLVATLYATDTLTSPMLPGFACPVTQLFGDIQPLSQR
jgi:Uma2 family endonuclease